MRPIILLIVALTAPGAAFGAGVGYARATSQLKKDARPTLYQPLNLLDGREASVWCEGASGDGVGEKVVIGFKGPTRFDEIRITNGDGKEESTFKVHNRVIKLLILEENSRRTLTFPDSRTPQSIKLEPPIETERVVLEIAEVAKGDGGDDATCLSDVVFVNRGHWLNGPYLTEKLKYDRGRAALMNSWTSGPEGAPDRYFDFFFDGTYQFVYRPFDPDEKPIELRGEYNYDGRRLMLKVGNEWIDAKARRHSRGGDDGVTRTALEIAADAVKQMRGTWTHAAP